VNAKHTITTAITSIIISTSITITITSITIIIIVIDIILVIIIIFIIIIVIIIIIIIILLLISTATLRTNFVIRTNFYVEAQPNERTSSSDSKLQEERRVITSTHAESSSRFSSEFFTQRVATSMGFFPMVFSG
jgi:hypothetical protein